MTGQRVVKCPRGRTLGVYLDAEDFEQRHQRRTTKFSGQGSVTITCESCGRSTAVQIEKVPAGAV